MTTKQHPAQKDFRVFMFMVWRHLNLPEPTPVQYDIAHYLQHGPRRSVIEAFRGVGKSWITSALVCWVLWNDPQKKILVISASKERADAFSTFVKRLINELPVLQHLKPKADQRDSMISFDVGPATPDHSPSVKSVGINGQITGSRADIIIADDVEVPNNSATQMMRDKLSEAVKEMDAVIKPLQTSRIIYLGTPQTEMSLYNALPERGYEARIWPALYPELHLVANYKGRLAPFITRALEADKSLVGAPTDPRRFNETDLLERKASYGRAGFALQFMLDTSLSDGDRYPLKIADLIVQNLNPTMAHVKIAWAAAPEVCINDLPAVALTGDRYYRPMWTDQQMSEYTGCVMAIDPSGRGADETGYAIIKILAGNLFLVAAGGLSGGYSDETLETLARLAKTHQVNHVIIEANFGDGMYTKLITPFFGKVGHKVLVEEVKHSTQKEARIIDTLEPVLSTHRLIVDQKVIENDFRTAEQDIKYSLFYQMTRITRDKGALAHDDRLDALAIAVAYWTEHMSRDNDKAAAAIKDKALKDELKKFVHGVLGSKPKRTSWMSSNSGSR
ncbi:terminase large subunit [Ralstonia phage vRsoP-WF2]|uniref:Terminase, large subunit n=1 Tax=Ralstonia phage RsoP1EGY TaxID=2070026 RepID=A0A2R2ZGE7_9CAUD|nr:terminase large subunit [Ralstonia phage RsoP1EGY]AUO78208.1 putative terminase protein large subunit [Ralstonia phage RsoP1EGY]UHX60291.1 terminase large subunit [Ralstonia phage vRsoP-WF2]UHX60343.1 terminase large subunit [Ralstonia phage vRsoP-WM2]